MNVLLCPVNTKVLLFQLTLDFFVLLQSECLLFLRQLLEGILWFASYLDCELGIALAQDRRTPDFGYAAKLVA